MSKLVLFVFVLLSLSFASSSQPKGLYLSLEQRIVLSYAVQAYGLPENQQEVYLERAQAYIQKALVLPPATIKVANFNEFLAHFRGEWPSTNSLEQDLLILESKPIRPLFTNYVASPRVRRQIEAYMAEQVSEAAQWLHGAKVPLAASLGKLPMLRKFVVQLGSQVTEGFFTEFDQLGGKMSQSSQVWGDDLMMRKLLETLFGEYFSRLSLDSKKLIVSSFVGGNLRMSDLEKFETLIQNSGPSLQKLLQIVARQRGMDPELKRVLQRLESSVRPVPWVQVQELLMKEAGAERFVSFERKPLGVGSMAQVHRAKIKNPQGGRSGDVVVRFIKPGIAARVAEDGRILQAVAQILDSSKDFAAVGGPKLKPLVEEVTRTVEAELHQDETKLRQIQGKVFYDRDVAVNTPGYKGELHIRVPKILEISESNPSSQLMIQEMVFGKKLESEYRAYQDIMPHLKQAVSEAIAAMWAEEVLFGKGFYHSDLHQGNFLVQVTDAAIKVNVLDFGMGGLLPREMQNQVLVLAAGIDSLNTKLIVDSFWKIAKDADRVGVSKEELSIQVTQVLNEIKTHQRAEMDLEKWTIWMTDRGFSLPYDFVNLNRGLVIINKMLKEAGSPYDATQIMRRIAIRQPINLLRRLVVEEKVPKLDLLKLGWVQTGLLLKGGAVRCEAVFL